MFSNPLFAFKKRLSFVLQRFSTMATKLIPSNLLDKKYLVRLTMSFVEKFGCCPVKLIPEMETSTELKFVPKSSREQVHLNLKCSLHFILTCVLLGQCLLPRLTNSSPSTVNSSDEILAWLVLIINLISSCYLNLIRNKQVDLSVFLNNIFQFKPKFQSSSTGINNMSKNSLSDVLLLVFIPFALYSCAVFPPVFVMGFDWNTPCKPSLIGYFLIYECNCTNPAALTIVQTLLNLVSKIAISLINIYILYFGITMVLCICALVHILSIITIKEKLQYFLTALKNCVELHHNLQMYRDLQIFNTLLNKVQHNCLAIMMAGNIIISSVSLVFLVRVGNSNVIGLNLIIIGAIVFAFVDSISFILFLLGGMIQTYILSKKLLANVKRLGYKSRQERVWSRKFLKSCDKIRIKFSDCNFLEELTPLRCFDIAVNLSVQILLLTRGNDSNDNE